jgi:hypothetical protein
MLTLDYELRPLPACRPTKMAGKLVLGFAALSDGAVSVAGPGGPLLPNASVGWPRKRLAAPDTHVLTFLDDLCSVLAIQTRPQPVPTLLGEGHAGALLDRLAALLAAEDDAGDVEAMPEDVLAAGDYLVARSVYLPGDTRLLVLDRGEAIELACEGLEGAAPRGAFLEELRGLSERFFVQMTSRAESASQLQALPGALAPVEVARQGQQWQRRVEALLKRSVGEKFDPLVWAW